MNANLGWSVSAAGDLNGDGYADFVAGAPGDDAGTLGTYVGRAYVYFGGPGADEVPDLILNGENNYDNFGLSVAAAGDVNADGYDDLIVGSFGASEAVSNAGAAYVFFGGPLVDAIADVTLSGPTSGSQFGISVAGAGDLNRDGFDDVLIGAPAAAGQVPGAGAAYVFFGGATPDAVADIAIQGTNADDYFGRSVASAGDMSGDGVLDVIIGAPGADPFGQSEAGLAMIYAGTSAWQAPPVFAIYTYATFVAGDQVGYSVAGLGDVNGDGFDDVAIGAPFADTPTADAGRVGVILGAATTLDFIEVTITRLGAGGDHFGHCVASVGDLNSDGYPDLGVGAPNRDRLGGEDVGSVFLYLLGPLGMVWPPIDTVPDLTFDGPSSSANLGYSVAAAGDIRGDGFPDFVMGAPRTDAGGVYSSGQAFLWEAYPYRVLSPNGGEQWVAGRSGTVRWLGRDPADVSLSIDGGLSWSMLASGVGGQPENEWSVIVPPGATTQALVRLSYKGELASHGNSDQSNAPFRIVPPLDPHKIAVRSASKHSGAVAFDHVGASVSSAGDMNADGYPDIIVGAPGDDAVNVESGRAFIHFGGPESDDLPDLVLNGWDAMDHFGASVAGGGDFNADGFDDVVVGVPGSDAGGPDAGIVLVFFGGPYVDGVSDFFLPGAASGDEFGTSVAYAGDVNGDHATDLIVGAPFNDAAGAGSGCAYVYLGGASLSGAPAMSLPGVSAGDRQGASVSGAGDVDGDGYGDVIVGAPENDAGGSNAGRASVYFGGRTPDPTADLLVTGATPGDNLGAAVTGGDFDGDGYSDFVVGAPLYDAGGADAGRAFVYLGGPLPDVTADATLLATSMGDHFGAAAAVAGDVNADGFPDFLIGAPTADPAGVLTGRAYLYFGGPGFDAVPDLVASGAQAYDAFGVSIAGAGDTNGDGFGDFLVGAPEANAGDIDTGAIFRYDCNRYFVTSPNGGETWDVGAPRAISWMGEEPADVWLSSDGGATYDRIASHVGGESSNSFAIRVPHVPTRHARVRVSPADPQVRGADASDSSFTIQTSISLLFFLAAPAPQGESGALLSWSTNPGLGDLVGYRLERSRESAAWNLVADAIQSSTYHDPDAVPGDRYRIHSINGLGEDLVLGETLFQARPVLGAWPIPYRGGELNIGFSVSGQGAGDRWTEVGIFDIRGRLVRWISRNRLPRGYHQVGWDGRDEHGRAVASGVYFIRSNGAAKARPIKLVVMR